MNRATKKAIKSYGREKCLKAFAMSEEGWGARGISCEFGTSTNTADAMINAGRIIELHERGEAILREGKELIKRLTDEA
jgi:hypothetical protein